MRSTKQLKRRERSPRRDFASEIARAEETLGDLKDIEVVVGIPFQNGDVILPNIVQTARQGLENMGLAGRAVVACVGPWGGSAALDMVLAQINPDGEVAVRGFLLGEDFEGRGWSIRALMKIASKYKCPLVLLRPDLTPQPGGADEEGQGFSPRWIHRLHYAVSKHGQDLALAQFSRHPFAHPVESLLAYPVIAGVFGFSLRQPTPGIFALSHRLNLSCLSEAEKWSEETGNYGFDPWVVAHALVEELSICGVPLGAASFRHGIHRLKPVFHQITHVLLEGIVSQRKWWLGRADVVFAPQVSGTSLDVSPPKYHHERYELLRHFKLEFNHFDETLFREIVPDEVRERMEQLADKSLTDIGLSAEEWIHILQRFLLAYRFERGFHPDDIVDGLFPFFLARFTSFMSEVWSIENALSSDTFLDPASVEKIVRREAEGIIESEADLFVAARPEFRKTWQERETETASYLPRLGAWEFVPHVGVILPQELDKSDGDSVWASQVYQELIDRYRGEFTRFLSDQLGIEEVIDSSDILSHVHAFMHKVEWALNVDIFPFEHSTVEGTGAMADRVREAFFKGECFQLRPDNAKSIIEKSPPSNLIMQLGCNNVAGLLTLYEPCEALSRAAWTDRQYYLERVLDILQKDGQPEWFHIAPLTSSIIDVSLLGSASDLHGTAALSRLAGRVMVSNLPKGRGGDFPKLYLLLRMIKSFIGVELFSEIWQGFADEGIDFSERLVKSIRGHWGRRVLSAHNAFENKHQRILVERLKRFAKDFAARNPKKADAAEMLEAAADVYHLSITLPDATFVPLSAWTWTSFSYRGGLGAPTPLSSLVERDWATRDFLTAYIEKAGLGDAETIDKKIVELISEGRESESLREHLFEVSADVDRLVVLQTPSAAPPPAGKLIRPVNQPIIEPIAGNSWESRYVLNAAAVRLDGKIYILYRAFGDDEISRIGLAWTKDGIHIDGRLDYPIYQPGHPTERAGTEDPRVIVIDDRIYMLYTAWDLKLAQIAMASIPVQAFLEFRFDAWEYNGLAFPGLANKDAVIYPEKFNRGYAIYHRIDPSMWISYMDDLNCPWPREGHQIVVAPRPGMMWDGVKIGAGAQPIKTTHGWLNIYHGVDYERSYRLGALFMELDDPAKVIYQTPNPILEPETEFEVGKTGGKDYWVPHVVFTCGAVPAVDKEVVEPDDEIYVYYGAADTVIGVAKGRLRDIVPIFTKDE